MFLAIFLTESRDGVFPSTLPLLVETAKDIDDASEKVEAYASSHGIVYAAVDVIELKQCAKI